MQFFKIRGKIFLKIFKVKTEIMRAVLTNIRLNGYLCILSGDIFYYCQKLITTYDDE